MRIGTLSRSLVLLVVATVVLAGMATPVAADEVRGGGTIIVGPDETVQGLTAFGGTVIVEGTVEGDLTGLAGTVIVDGTVTGDLSMAAGTVQINGRVGGDVSASAGTVTLGAGAVVGDDFQVGAGTIVLDGTVTGDARVGADTITVGSTAAIGGDLRYDGSLRVVDGAAIAGQTVRDSALSVGTPFGGIPQIPAWVITVYTVLANLVLGAILLAVFPGLSRRLADTVETEPLRAAGVGLLTLVVVPVVLVLIAVTIIGIPITILGAILFGLTAWVAYVYGTFAIGTWSLGQFEVDNRWLALVVGVVGIAILSSIPVLGGLFDLAAFLLGLGALALLANRARRDRRSESAPQAPAESEGGDVPPV